MPMDTYMANEANPYSYQQEPQVSVGRVPPLHLSIESLTNYADDCDTASGGIPPAPLPPHMPGPSHHTVPSIHIQPESDRPPKAPRK